MIQRRRGKGVLGMSPDDTKRKGEENEGPKLSKKRVTYFLNGPLRETVLVLKTLKL
jgi:hypothetical protein